MSVGNKVGEGVQVMNSVGVILAVMDGDGGRVWDGRMVRVGEGVAVAASVQVGEAVGDGSDIAAWFWAIWTMIHPKQ